MHLCLHPDSSIVLTRKKSQKNCTSHWSIPQSNQYTAAVITAQTSKHRTLTSILNTTFPLLSQNSVYSRSAYQKSHSPTWKITRAHNTSIKELRTRTKNGNRGNYFASSPRKKTPPLLPTSICCTSQLLWPHFKVLCGKISFAPQKRINVASLCSRLRARKATRVIFSETTEAAT